MKIFQYGSEPDKNCVLCLGHFDGLHLGHRAVVEFSRELAKSLGSEVAVFTFDDGFSPAVKGERSILTLKERLSVFENFGVERAVVAKTTDELISTEPRDFLQKLYRGGKISAVVAGEDYTFGKGGAAGAKTLKSLSEMFGVAAYTVPEIIYEGEKISSTRIKKLLECGEVRKANALLGYEYFSMAKVLNGAGVGRMLGFPTMNTFFPASKKQPKRGVYATRTEVNGREYLSITNFGSAPTFDRNNLVIETHILDFSEDIYGEQVKISFVEYLREIRKFPSIDELTRQIEKDIESVRKI